MAVEHLDTEALDELKEVMEEEFESLIHTFVVDSEKKLMALRAAIDSKDEEMVGKVGHSFKGSCSNIGALHLTDLCKKVEDKGRANDLSGINELYVLVKEEYSIVKHALNDLI